VREKWEKRPIQKKVKKKMQVNGPIERENKQGRPKQNFYAKGRELSIGQPILLIRYKETLFSTNTNESSDSLPSSFVSLLQDFEDVFPE